MGKLIEIPDSVRGAFGEMVFVEPQPVVQILAQYNVTGNSEVIAEGGGAVDLSNSQFELSTGVAAGALAGVRSPRGSVYRAGQGIRCRFTARFNQPSVIGSSLVAGLNNPTDALVVGYREDEGFGILHRHSGRVEMRELLIETATAGIETVTVVIDGLSYPLVGIPFSTDTADNARTIADALLLTAAALTWVISACGSIVTIYSRILQGPRDGVYSVSSSGALTGTWSRITAGVTPVSTFYQQADWNLNTLRVGTPEVQDWSKYNVFELRIQYLGGGALTICVEDSDTGHFFPVHRIRWANLNTKPSFTQPAFRMGWFAQSRTSTTDLLMAGASGSILNEGPIVLTGETRGHDEVTTIPTSAPDVFVAALVVRARSSLGGLPNLAIARMLSASVTSDAGKSSRVRIFKNPTLTPPVNFAAISASSLLEIGATGSVATDGDLVVAKGLPRLLGVEFDLLELNAVLLETDVLVIAINLTGGSDSDFTAALNWGEDV